MVYSQLADETLTHSVDGRRLPRHVRQTRAAVDAVRQELQAVVSSSDKCVTRPAGRSSGTLVVRSDA